MCSNSQKPGYLKLNKKIVKKNKKNKKNRLSCNCIALEYCTWSFVFRFQI